MNRLGAPESRNAGADPRLNSGARPGVLLVSLGVGLMSFLATEVMHYLLVPDLGRRWERWLAEGVSALVVAFLTGRLLRSAHQQREATLLRMQVISEMNHHVRNALAAIILTAESGQNQQSLQVIAESVGRIEWALREVLLRRKPLQERPLNQPRYFEQRRDTAETSENSHAIEH